MLPLVINNINYKCRNSWEEITLTHMEDISVLLSDIPDKIKEQYLSGQVPDADSEIMQPYWYKMISVLADIPENISFQASPKHLKTMASSILDPLIVSILGSPLYEPVGISEFEYKGEIYKLPADGIDVMGEVMPMSIANTKEMCEASDVAAASDFKVAPLLVSILCRPDGEAYDEEIVKSRTKIFIDLPSYIYLEVLNRLAKTHSYLMVEYPLCYGMKESGAPIRGQGKKTSWGDRMLYVADDKPSELPLVEEMPFYDFIRLLNGKIKRQREQCQIK